jgi:hypothetical protein
MRRKKRFTIRSSREWKLIAANRPPSASLAKACGSAASSHDAGCATAPQKPVAHPTTVAIEAAINTTVMGSSDENRAIRSRKAMTVWPVQDAKARFSDLIDTNVVSELRRPKPHGALLASVTLGEIQAGIELTRDQDPAKAAEIE